MFTIASLWVPFTVVAALGQVARNAMQRSLTGPLGTWGATNIRFLFGFPFSLVFLAIVLIANGDSWPSPGMAFWPWLLLGALAQIAATGPDAGGDDRPVFRRYNRLSEDRDDPDRDLRLCLSWRPPDRAQGAGES